MEHIYDMDSEYFDWDLYLSEIEMRSEHREYRERKCAYDIYDCYDEESWD